MVYESYEREAREPHTPLGSLPSLALCFQPRSKPLILFDCSRILEYAKIRTVLQSTTQCALNKHNYNGRLHAFSLFFLALGAKRTINEKTTRVNEGPRFSRLCRSKLARACTGSQSTQRGPKQSVCSRLLFYRKCTGLTVFFAYSDLSLSM